MQALLPKADVPANAGDHISMIPRLSAIVTACVQSLASSLLMMFFMRALTVSSDTNN